MLQKLTADELSSATQSLQGWEVRSGKLHREYKFADFNKAFGFMSAAAPEIDKMNHHPEWSNVYNRVVVDLTTHDSGGVTKKDVELAQLLDSVAARFQ